MRKFVSFVHPFFLLASLAVARGNRSLWKALTRDPLVDWLDQLRIEVPDQSFSAGMISVKIRGLVCTHFSIQRIQSNYTPSNVTADSMPDIQLRVFNISASCEGTYQSTGASGKLTAELVGYEALRWTLQVHDDNESNCTFREPGSVETTDCSTSIQVANLHFSGSFSAKLLDLFKAKIEHAVNSAVEDQICPVMHEKLDPVLTHYVKTAVDWLRPYTDDLSATKMNDHTISLDDESSSRKERSLLIDLPVDSTSPFHFAEDVPVLLDTLTFVNNFLEKHMNIGFIPILNQTTTQDKCGGFIYGVNGILKQVFQESWTLPLKPQHIHFDFSKLALVDVHLHGVKFAGDGLHEWKNLTVLRPMDGSETEIFQTILDTPSAVSVTAHLTVDVVGVEGGYFHGEPLHESFFVEINTTSLAAAMNLVAYVDKDVFQELTVGSIAEAIENPKNSSILCLLKPFRSLEAQLLSSIVRVSDIAVLPDVDIMYTQDYENLERDMDFILDNVLKLLLSEYQLVIERSLAGLSKGPVLDGLNRFFANLIATTDDLNCTVTDDPSLQPNFDYAGILRRINTYLKQNKTLAGINNHINCVTDLFGVVVKQEVSLDDIALLSHGTPIDENQSSVHLREFNIEHFGSIRNISLLEPGNDDNILESQLLLSSQDEAGARPRVFVSVNVIHAAANLSATINATISFDDIEVAESMLLNYDMHLLQHMTLSALLKHGQCILVPTYELNIADFVSKLALFEATVTASLLSADFISQPRTLTINSTKYPAFQDTANFTFYWVTNTLYEVSTVVSRSILSHSGDFCGGHKYPFDEDDDPDGGGTDADINSSLLILAAIFVFAQPAILLVKRSQSTGQQDLRSLSEDLTEPLLLHPRYTGNITNETPTNANPALHDSLMFDSHVPEYCRHLLPGLVIVALVLLVSSNLNAGATVDLVMNYGEKHVKGAALFEFSLLSTAKAMLNAKIYPLFFLVVVFSGVWPYAKLLLMLFAWITPRGFLSNERREDLLLRLDALSKFSLVDTYVLVGELQTSSTIPRNFLFHLCSFLIFSIRSVMLVAFRYSFQLADKITVDAYVEPQFGFYGFLAATTLSLVIGHGMVYFHRRSDFQFEIETMEKSTIIQHAFKIDDSGTLKMLSQKAQVFLKSMFFLNVLLLIIGMTRKSFIFEFDGVAGLILGESRRSSYSLLSLGAAIPESVESPDAFVYILQLAYFFYAGFAPLATLILLFLVLTMPLTLTRQLQLLTLAEIANAWSAVEVFALSIVTAVLEISTFASFIIGNHCDSIADIIHDSTGYSGSCFSVHASVRWDAVYLVVGAATTSFWVSFVLTMSHATVHERAAELIEKRSGELPIADSKYKSLMQWIAISPLCTWLFCSDEGEEDSSEGGPPLISEQLVTSPWEEEESFTEEWKVAAEKDPDWKQWKEATRTV
jgi:hypothetical protein